MKLSGKRILIIGGTGSLGQALIRRESKHNKLFIVSRDEAKHWTIKNQLEPSLNVEFIVGDIRDNNRIDEIIRNVKPNIIVLAAALKQVDTCEKYPYESIQTNLIGIQNVISVVRKLENQIEELEKVLLISTDKACAPTNVYGMSKALSERIVTSSALSQSRIKFLVVRYGNVLESRGSIIPLFRILGERKKVLSVTHESMTRFIMTLDQSIDLIEDTLDLGKSGQIWLPKLKSMKIIELAEIFAEYYDTKIEISNIRPGEKIHEELVSEPESLRITDEFSHMILEPFYLTKQSRSIITNYSSADYLITKSELKEYLERIGIFTKPIDEFLGRQIDEISVSRDKK